MSIGNFGGNFWSNFRNFQSSKAIDEKLSQENVSLEEILDDEDVIQELKTWNTKLLDFFDLPRTMELVSYITEIQEDNYKKQYKFPFVASELVSCEVRDFTDKLLSPTVLHKLLSFFKNLPLNPTLLGYVQKAISALLKRNPKLITDMMTEQGIFPYLLSQVHLRGVSDILENILGDEETSIHKVHILQGMIMSLASSCACTNAASVLMNIMNAQTTADSKPLVSELMKENTIAFIVDNLHNESALVVKHSALVLKALAKTDTKPTVATEDSPLFADNESDIVLDNLVVKLDKICESIGEERRIVGEDRIGLCDLLVELVSMNNMSLNFKLAEFQLSKSLVKLFFKHEWNSAFHHIFERYVTSVLNSDSDELRKDLLSSDLLRQMVSCNPKSALCGHIKLIGNTLVKLGETQHDIKNAMHECADWKRFIVEFLEPKNRIEAGELGSRAKNKQKIQISEDEEFTFAPQWEIQEDMEKALEEPITLEDINWGAEFSQVNFWKIRDQSIELDSL